MRVAIDGTTRARDISRSWNFGPSLKGGRRKEQSQSCSGNAAKTESNIGFDQFLIRRMRPVPHFPIASSSAGTKGRDPS